MAAKQTILNTTRGQAATLVAVADTVNDLNRAWVALGITVTDADAALLDSGLTAAQVNAGAAALVSFNSWYTANQAALLTLRG